MYGNIYKEDIDLKKHPPQQLKKLQKIKVEERAMKRKITHFGKIII